MSETYVDRVDLGILAAASRLARLRDGTVRGGLEDFLASAEENVRDSLGTADEGVWRLRVDRSRELSLWTDASLRETARVAAEKGY